MTVRNLFCALLCALSAPALLPAKVLPSLPLTWRWTSDHEVALSLDGTFAHEDDRLVDARTGKVTPLAPGMVAASAAADGSAFPADMVNATWSPDSAHVAFTKGNDLWVKDMQSGETRRLTHDGSDTILNGYASWVYYEEIFGRPSRYRAFWWSPDSRKVAFYRFDNADVPVFPIYSPYAEDYDRSWLGVYSSQAAGAAVPLDGVSPTGGSVRMTRYPKCGDPNPKVRIGIADLDRGGEVVWADFNEEEDQYFGTPFWGADSRRFFVQREPRTQNTLDLYAVSPEDGSKQCIYHETYPTWLDWIDGMLFGRDGLYMVRSFETDWQQIYYLSYDGTVCKRLTDGQNWRVRLLTVKEGKKTATYDGTASEVVFTAERDSRIRSCLYMARKGAVKVLSDPDCMVAMVSVSPGKDYAVGMESSLSTPYRFRLFDFAKPARSRLLADSADPDDPSLGMFPAPRVETIRTDDGLELPAIVLLPKDFDPSRKYPVHMDIYGGPDTPMVYDRWIRPGYEEFSMNGIIEVIADCRAAGHNGRAGLDAIYGRLGEKEVQDFVAWAEHFKSLGRFASYAFIPAPPKIPWSLERKAAFFENADKRSNFFEFPESEFEMVNMTGESGIQLRMDDLVNFLKRLPRPAAVPRVQRLLAALSQGEAPARGHRAALRLCRAHGILPPARHLDARLHAQQHELRHPVPLHARDHPRERAR